MKNTAPISVVIPCFNGSQTIKRAIESVFKQTLLPEEVIIINDASNDDTIKIIEELQQKYPEGWIKIHTFDSNKGSASARNKGILISQNEIIALLDADDAWCPEKINLQFNILRNNPNCGICGTDYEVVNHMQLKLKNTQSNPMYSIKKITKFQCLVRNPLITPSLMIRKSLTPKFPESQRYADDHMVIMEYAINGGEIYKINTPLVHVFKHMYGSRGLNSHLLSMQLGEFKNYLNLFLKRKLSLLSLSFLMAYSTLKFLRRLVIVALYKIRYG